MKKESNKPEILTLDEKYYPLFKKAIENTSNRTLITCDSITCNDSNFSILIYETRSYFLLILGEEYFKLTLSSYLKKNLYV